MRLSDRTMGFFPLLSAVLLLLSPLATVASPDNSTDPLELSASPRRFCYANPIIGRSPQALYAACNEAVLRLPQSAWVLNFHQANPSSDPSGLPRTIIVGNCKVSVGFVTGFSAGSSEQSSWPQIAGVATQLMNACLHIKPTNLALTTAGKVTTGERGRIEVTVERAV